MAGEGPKPRPEDILDGWKAIAEYLRLTERTVQRWTKDARQTEKDAQKAMVLHRARQCRR